jgi:hypothetical protein
MSDTHRENEKNEADALASIIDSVPHPDDDLYENVKPGPTKKKMTLPQKAMFSLGAIMVILMGSYAYLTLKPKPLRNDIRMMASTTALTSSAPPISILNDPTSQKNSPSAEPVITENLKIDTASTAPTSIALNSQSSKDASPFTNTDIQQNQTVIQKNIAIDNKTTSLAIEPMTATDRISGKNSTALAERSLATSAEITIVETKHRNKEKKHHIHKKIKKLKQLQPTHKKVLEPIILDENGYTRLF